ncbi:Uncharacterised protein [Vibrio cholerae]|uniref:Uncharacterized protein n=1 Tax=Vibrio cholerae TaxID=666 RepID=A0A656A6J2_VIBCL|nr:Uncharacterised protein [Vibrio cholerae]
MMAGEVNCATNSRPKSIQDIMPPAVMISPWLIRISSLFNVTSGKRCEKICANPQCVVTLLWRSNPAVASRKTPAHAALSRAPF